MFFIQNRIGDYGHLIFSLSLHHYYQITIISSSLKTNYDSDELYNGNPNGYDNENVPKFY